MRITNTLFTTNIEISRSLHKMLRKAWAENVRMNGLVSWNQTFEDYCEYFISSALVKAQKRAQTA